MATMHALAAQLPTVRLYNGYGPTEATVFCTVWQCRLRDDVPAARPAPPPPPGEGGRVGDCHAPNIFRTKKSGINGCGAYPRTLRPTLALKLLRSPIFGDFNPSYQGGSRGPCVIQAPPKRRGMSLPGIYAGQSWVGPGEDFPHPVKEFPVDPGGATRIRVEGLGHAVYGASTAMERQGPGVG